MNFSLRKTCPGVSQCYDRNMVEIMINFLNHNPFLKLYTDLIIIGQPN